MADKNNREEDRRDSDSANPSSEKSGTSRIERRSKNRPFSGAPRKQKAEGSGHDVSKLKALLDEHFHPEEVPGDGSGDGVAETPETDNAPEDDKVAKPKKAGAAQRMVGRVVKSLIGVAVLIVVGIMPAQRLLQVSSVEAVVNAPLVTVRAPIAGVVGSVSDDLQAGRQVAAQGPLMTITNPRADASRVVAYSDRLENLQFEHSSKAAKLKTFTGLESELEARVKSFTANRILQLKARLEQTDARIEGAVAAFDKAKANEQRYANLVSKGIASTADMETAESEARMAEQTVRQYRAEKDELNVELNALNKGTFLGDDYNDRPQSAQRLEEVKSTIASLKADLKAGDVQIDWARKTLDEEKRRYAMASKVEVAAPAGGEIWQVLASPGERVEAGEPLLNILDCSNLLVTAVVSESVYNSLTKGAPAAFRFREGGTPLKGKVILLSGMATASSDLAIMPEALTRESYRVTVSLDNPYASQGVCAIGRTGRVVFGRDAV
ncbi:MAG: HlyD family efflux transporter periplasmic adaptor subunit [Salaquimonas sp.]|nr:HlyD family efflux transporter periplasmic adaptor subunit [Salaquimonas sp.]